MKKISLLLVLLIVAACQDAIVGPDNPPNLRTLSQSEIQVASGANDFAFKLFTNIQEDEPKNTFISPLSVSMAMAMLINGAEGETQQSILNTIDFGDFSPEEVNAAYETLSDLLLSMDRKIELGVANSVWYDSGHPVNEDFASIIRTSFDGQVEGLDFSAGGTKEKINGWVEDETHGKIKDLIQEIRPEEIMFLINAIYFKGEWTYQFNKLKTHHASFTNLDGSASTVDMMFSNGVKINYHREANLQAFDIPYGNQQFNFTVILPNDPSQLLPISSEMNSERLSSWFAVADSATVELELPRFKMEWKKDIKEELGEMGMLMAGFPKLFANPTDTEVSRVVHQTFLEVNEEGSEAAAATAVGISVTSMPPTPMKITIDKPFLFMIREKHSGVVLFMGQVVEL